MSFIAFKQNGTTGFGNGYVGSAVTGPLNSRQTPGQMQPHNLGVLSGVRPNPPQFYPANGASEFSNSRHQYIRTNSNLRYPRETGIKNIPNQPPVRESNSATHRSYLVSQSTKYIAPQSSSLHIATRRSEAVGKSSYKVGLPTDANLSYKNFNNNDVKSRLRMIRGGGTVAPAKQGSIFNKATMHTVNVVGAGGVLGTRSTY